MWNNILGLFNRDKPEVELIYDDIDIKIHTEHRVVNCNNNKPEMGKCVKKEIYTDGLKVVFKLKDNIVLDIYLIMDKSKWSYDSVSLNPFKVTDNGDTLYIKIKRHTTQWSMLEESLEKGPRAVINMLRIMGVKRKK